MDAVPSSFPLNHIDFGNYYTVDLPLFLRYYRNEELAAMDGGERLHGAAASLPSPSMDRMHDLCMRNLGHRMRSAWGRQTDGDCSDCGASDRGSYAERQSKDSKIVAVVLVFFIIEDSSTAQPHSCDM